MKAWLVYSLSDMRLEEIPDPKPEPGEVLVKIKVVQPSVSEVIRFRGGDPFAERLTNWLSEKGPLRLFGHEYSGEVVAVGDRVNRLKVGDRVASGHPQLPCGRCGLCRVGRGKECLQGPSVGRDIPGCFAEYASLPEGVLIHIPREVSYGEGATVQPLGSCLSAVDTANIQLGDTIAVFGQGTMGLGTMQIAKVSGAGLIIAVDVLEQNLKLAKQLGADITIDARKTDPVKAINDITNDIGVDIAFEAAGGRPKEGLSGLTTFRQCVKVVRGNGKIVQIANLTEPNVLEPRGELQEKGVAYMFPPHFFSELLQTHLVHLLASKRIQTEPMITHRLKGLDKTLEAFEITGAKAKYGAVNPAQVIVSE